MYPRGYKDKFKDVPRDPANPNEIEVTITKFTKSCYDREQKKNVHISDGKPIKRNQPEDKDQADTKSSKKQKSKKGNNNKNKGRKDDPASYLSSSWLQKHSPSQVGELLLSTTATVLIIALN